MRSGISTSLTDSTSAHPGTFSENPSPITDSRAKADPTCFTAIDCVGSQGTAPPLWAAPGAWLASSVAVLPTAGL